MFSTSNQVKIGYFRIVNEKDNTCRFMSYAEYLSFDKSYIDYLKKRNDLGEIKLYCGCSSENNLELTITENLVIRVKTNHQQELHKKSCPKSMYYQSWVNTSKKGVFLLGNEGEMIFNITMPSVVKSSSGGVSSSTSSSSNPLAHTSLLSMITTFNAVAWEKQTFSIKKKIGIAHKNNEILDWNYKNADEFLRLMYGVSNDILVKNGKDMFSLHQLLYNKEEYYNNTDYKRRFLIFSEILKVGDYKEDRKYQYVTISLHSMSSYKTTVRVPTEMFSEIFKDNPPEDGCKRFLAGYVYRKVFQDNDWMTLLKGFVVYTSTNGLYAESPEIARFFNYLSEKKILFKRCYQPIESYGDNIPTMVIERLHGKDILIDFVRSKQMRGKRNSLASNNEEYKIYSFTYDELLPDQIYDLIFSRK